MLGFAKRLLRRPSRQRQATLSQLNRTGQWRKRFPRFQLSPRQSSEIVGSLKSVFREAIDQISRQLPLARLSSQYLVGGPNFRRLNHEPLEPKIVLAVAADLFVNDNWFDLGGGFVDNSTDTGGAPTVTAELGVDAFDTLPDALAAADPGESIEILRGSYSDITPVTISGDVTIFGEPLFKPDFKKTFSTTDSGDGQGWWVVDGGVELHLSNVAFDGLGDDTHQAIRHKGFGTIDDVDFVDIDAPGDSAGTGVVFFPTSGGMDLQLTGSDFGSMGRAGALFFGSGVTGDFNGNTYTGNGAVSIVEYGVEVGAGADVGIDNNMISDAAGDTGGFGSAGVLVTGDSVATVTNNTIMDGLTGVIVGTDPSDTSMVDIEGNTFSGNELDIVVDGGDVLVTENLGFSAGAFVGQTAISVDGGMVTVTDETIDGADVAVSVFGGTVDIINSTISGNAVGVEIGGTGSATITDSALIDNTVAAVDNMTLATIDADDNWWGDVSGPLHTTNVLGLGDEILGPVDFDPWVGKDSPAGEIVVEPDQSSAALQAIVDVAAGAGDDVATSVANDTELDAILDGLAGLTSPGSPIDVKIDFTTGTFSSLDVTVPANITLIIDGEGGTVEFESGSPALTVSGGDVQVESMAIFTDTLDDGSPAILVTGSTSTLTMLDSTVEEDDTETGTPLIKVELGATLNIDAANGGGGNTFTINNGLNVLDAGSFIDVDGGSTVNVDGTNTLNVNVPENTAFDIDVRLDGTSVSSVSQTSPAPTHGTVALVSGKLRYTPDTDYNGPASFSFSLAGGLTSQTVNLEVLDINDAPDVTVPGGIVVAEEATTPLITGISIADDDVGVADLTVELTVTGGILDSFDPSALLLVDSGGAGTASVTLRGDLTALNDALVLGFDYTGDNNFFGAETLTVTVNDLGSTGLGGPMETVETIAITVTNVDDPFAMTGDNDVTVDEADTVAITAIDLDNDDPDMDTVTYTITQEPGSTSGASGFAGGAGLTLDGGTTFLGNGDTFTQADVDGGILDYEHDASETGGGTDTAVFSVSDGTSTVSPVTLTININSINNDPTITAPATVTVDEETPTVIGAGISVNDTDSASLEVTLTVVDGTITATATGIDGFAALGAGALGSATFRLDGTLAELNASLATLEYTGALDDTGAAADTLTIDADDTTGGASTAVVDIDITDVNDDPVIITTTNVAVSEGQSIALTTANLDATDVDNTSDELTFTVTSGPTWGLLSSTTFTLDDIIGGTIFYNHGGGDSPTDSFDVDLTDIGGGGPISGTVNIDIANVNDVPVLDNPIPDQTATEEVFFSFTLAADTFRDPDNDVVPGTDTLTLTATLDGGAPLPAWLTFTPGTAEFSGTPQNADVLVGSIDVEVTSTDISLDSVSDVFTLSLVSVNDPPTVVTAMGSTPYTENSAGEVVDSTVTVVDTDDTDLEGATITIDNPEAGDELLFTDTANITGSFAAGELTLTGTDTVAAYQDALQSVEFAVTGASENNPIAGTRTIRFVVNDGDVDSDPTDGAPVIEEPPSGPILEDFQNVEVTAVNDDSLFVNTGPAFISEGGTFSLSAILEVIDPDDDPADIDITVNGLPAFGTVRNGATPVSTFTAAELASGTITYTQNGAEGILDSLTVVVEDNNPLTATADDETQLIINVAPVNDAPLVTPSGNNAYTEADPPLNIDAGIMVIEAEGDDVVSASITITNFVPGEDVIALADDLGDNITVDDSLAATTGVITLSGADTAAAYQAVFRAVTYANSSSTPDETTRIVEFVASDSMDTSAPGTVEITITKINTAPVLADGAGPLNYTENDPASIIETGLTITDVDDTHLVSATVTVTNFKPAEDVIFLVDDLGDSITLDLTDVGIGIITLNGDPTEDTLAAFEAALESVTYQNTSDDPDVTPRTVDFRVFDSGPNVPASNIITQTINITAVDDSPFEVENNAITIVEDSLLNPIAFTDLEFDDHEGDTPIEYTLVGNSPSVPIELVELSLVGVGPITVGGPNSAFTQADIDSGFLTVDSLGSDAVAGSDVATLTFDIRDFNGTLTSGVDFIVNITRVNDPPTIAGDDLLEATEEMDGTPADTVITLADLSGDDEEDDNATLTFTVDTVPVNGDLVIDGTVAVATGTFTQADVAAGDVVYRHTDTTNAFGGVAEDSFDYTITDSGAGGAPESVSSTLTIDVVEANDSPFPSAGTTLTAAVPLETSPAIALGNSEIGFEDDDDVDAQLTFKVVSIPTEGDLLISGVPAIVGDTFTQAQVAGGAAISYDYDDLLPESLTDSFTFTVEDNRTVGKKISGPHTLEITIGAVNDNLPVATDDGFTVDEGGTFDQDMGDLLDSGAVDLQDIVTDVDEPADVITVTSITGAANGVITQPISSDTFKYVHDGSETITDTITVNFSDGVNVTSADITVTINPVNDAPVVDTSGATGTDVAEGGTTTISIPSGTTIDDSDDGGGVMQLTISAVAGEGEVSATSGGGVAVFPDSLLATSIELTGTEADLNTFLTASFEFKADDDFAGTATVTLSVDDGGNTPPPAETGVDTLDVTVTEVNDAPVINGGAPITPADITEDTPSVAVTVDVFDVTSKGGGADEAGQTLTLTSAVLNSGVGTFNFSIATGFTEFTPAPDWFGSVEIEVMVEDDGTTDGAADPLPDTELIQFDVIGVDDAPVFTLAAITPIPEDTNTTVFGFLTGLDLGPLEGETLSSLTFDVLGEDPDTDAFTTLSIADPSGAGDLLIIPAADVTGTFMVELTITDGPEDPSGTETSTTETFEITVLNDNSDPPTAVDDTFNLLEGGTFDSPPSVLDNDTDPDPGDTKIVTKVNGVDIGTIIFPIALTNGTLTMDTDGEVTYTHDGSENLSDSFTYTMTDGNTLVESTATATFVMEGVNDSDPVADAVVVGSATGDEGGSFDFSSAGTTDGDLPNDILEFEWNFGDGSPTETTLSETISHVFADDGTFIVSMTVTDDNGNGSSDTVSVAQTITVNNVAPTVTLSGDNSIDENNIYTLNIDSVDDQGDDTVLTLVVKWGDGQIDFVAGPGTGPLIHFFTDDTGHNGTISVDVLDEDGFFTDAGTKSLTINNLPPTGNLANTGAVLPGSDGTAFWLSADDPSPTDVLFFDWDLDNNGTFEILNSTSSITVPGLLLTDPVNDHTVRGRIRDDDGGELIQTTTIDVLDGIGPTVTDVILDGSAWTSDFRDFVDGALGDLLDRGFVMGKGPDQLITQPWVNTNRVKFVFSEDVGASLSLGDFSIVQAAGSLGINGDGSSGAIPTFVGFSYDISTFTATLTLSGPLEASAVDFGIGAAGVSDIEGNALDGEWTNGVNLDDSGDGVAGGDFSYRVMSLPGDTRDEFTTSGSRIVNSVDSLDVRDFQNGFVLTGSGAFNYNARADLDGSNLIDAVDSLRVRDQQNAFLLATANLRAPMSAASAGSNQTANVGATGSVEFDNSPVLIYVWDSIAESDLQDRDANAGDSAAPVSQEVEANISLDLALSSLFDDDDSSDSSGLGQGGSESNDGEYEDALDAVFGDD